MCGIAGFVNRAGQRADRGIVERMTATLAHRGPDGDGIYCDGPAALGHRRLSIIDVAGGAQPMSNEDGSIWVSYNGELYNEPELRLELEAKGHRYRTTCDTESLVHLYEEEGPDFVRRLNGMFALAIWDRTRGPAGAGARPDGPEAALLRCAARRRPRVRLGAQGDPGASRHQPRARPCRAWRATFSTSMCRPRTRSGSRSGSCPAAMC